MDVNVWLSLLRRSHTHYQAARAWLDTVPPGGAGICRVVQLSVVRLLSNSKVSGPATLSAGNAWSLLQTLIEEEERVEFLPEPEGISGAIPGLLRYPFPTPKLVPDAYLAAFAMTLSAPLVTFDAGFQQFRSLQVTLLKL